MHEKYLRKERPPILSSYAYYCDLITLANRRVVVGKLKALSQSSFYYRVSKLPPYEVDVARYGKQYADRKYKPVGAHVRPTRVLERVEVDHTALDLLLLDDNLLVLLGRPYITALIDSFSKCLVGFYIGYKEPCYESVRKALLHAMLNKDYVRQKYPNVSCEWPCEGKVETLVVDNGAEFWSKNLEQACRSIVSDIQYNPVARPWLKPLIERFFGQLNQKFLASIPGKTFSGTAELEDYDPEKDAVMRFSTFMELFHKWVVDVYHQGPNSRGDHVPILMWKQGVREFPPLVYRGDDESRVMIDLAPTTERVLGKEGVRFAGLSYTSGVLDEFRKYNPPSGKSQGVKVQVKIDPNDLSKVYVYLPGRNNYVIANAVDPDGYTLGLSLFQHQTNRRFQRRFNLSQIDDFALAEARMYIESRINDEVEFIKNSPKSKKKISGMKKLARYKNLGSDGCSSVSAEAEVHKTCQVEGKLESGVEAQQLFSILDDWDSHVADWDPY
ncbi:putative transposase [Modicisalibacter muralis]|uniref:Putative transposase n=2 Tax=Modicisalibacter muralis TaxID=119000 RepID=A0A1G9LN92_9GAMM|nr:putative transposase [Halomonas muralis]